MCSILREEIAEGFVGGWIADGLSGMDIVNAENSALSSKKEEGELFLQEAAQ